MRGESMKDKSKKSTYSTTFGIDPIRHNTYCATNSAGVYNTVFLLNELFLRHLKSNSWYKSEATEYKMPRNRKNQYNVGCWCSRGDSNPHASRHMNLNHACLPISPLERNRIGKNSATTLKLVK